MSKNDAVLLVSRTLVLYLILWVLTDLTYLPELVFSFIHHLKQATPLSANNTYYRELDLIGLVFHLTKIIGLSILAGWLHRGGASVGALLLPCGLQQNPAQD
jgi:hypothetical protein